MKEVIILLFFRLNQQQMIMERYGDMNADLARQVGRNIQLEKEFYELCTFASPFAFFEVK